jgi:hypothetical protein
MRFVDGDIKGRCRSKCIASGRPPLLGCCEVAMRDEPLLTRDYCIPSRATFCRCCETCVVARGPCRLRTFARGTAPAVVLL